MRKIDIVGKRIGRWLVLSEAPKLHRYIEYECKCACGVKKTVNGLTLKSGRSKSCGCISNEITTKRNFRHGLRHSRIYNIWTNIQTRCNNPNTATYYRYGNLGIKCHWTSFLNFKRDMYRSYQNHVKKYGERNTTIDRINPYGDYQLDNCRWATYKQQNNNKKANYGKQK